VPAAGRLGQLQGRKILKGLVRWGRAPAKRDVVERAADELDALAEVVVLFVDAEPAFAESAVIASPHPGNLDRQSLANDPSNHLYIIDVSVDRKR
jgi:hypothetical protein